MSKVGKAVKVKEENEIQSFITSFKELEDPDDEPSTSGGSKKVYLSDQLESEDYDQIIVREDQGNADDYKYVFIVQDEEDGTEPKETEAEGEEIYEFDELEEDALEDDDKSKVVKVVSSSNSRKGGGQAAASQGLTHMCSFCNYSTPKRYLLARHMKCHSEDR